ncbi:MAG: S24 family peptidase, partial [Candidatus Pacebacteria bacterium]|nr:S24 family peptidase [Candidatus Paceibacterota bacterium]
MDNHKDKIFDFYSAHKRMPSYAEIMCLVGFKSKNAVYKLVNRLIEEGAVLKDKTGRLIPSRLFGEVPLLGLVEAGFPSVAEETPLDSLSLDDYLIEKKEKTYLLEVKGDSMIDAGIQEGDYVLAERG